MKNCNKNKQILFQVIKREGKNWFSKESLVNTNNNFYNEQNSVSNKKKIACVYEATKELNVLR